MVERAQRDETPAPALASPVVERAQRDETPAPAPALAASTPARALRRGLPRVPGGEPWPPEGITARRTAEPGAAAMVAASAVSGPSAPPVASVPQPTFETTADAGIPQPVPPDAAPAAVSVAAAAGSGSSLRRGLPRTPGGEPWPPPGAALAPAALPPAAPQPAAAVATPAIAEPVEASDAPAVVAERQALDVTVPLPFTRTVWPGENAFTRPAPKPAPKRYGPFTRGQWAGAVVVGGAGLLFAAAMAVLFVRWLLSLQGMQDFLAAYPGEYPLPAGSPVGIPPWLGWQHFFNVFLMVLIIRSGLQVRAEKRPTAFWSRRSSKRKISLNLWFHQSLDILWIVNGVIFIVLLFATGMWVKIVPTSWAVFPNAISAALQYVSLDWPTENGWVNYNSLQQLAYFATVFLAAPLAIATGVRMSGIWPKDAKALNKAYPVEWARAVHFPVMLYFVAFIIVHVTLVFATGALRNLNHMYASQDAVNWIGFWIFAASLVVIATGWVAARPLVLAPIARLFGTVSGR
ncbi:cytochrome b/b6 domain-containing protein [Microbacterium deminutum]|uniref:cytochrome b/b6 domain-containing protein n=1 Tax=Microbacterium deminutum TaxID=344164 RepID=UPI0031DFBDE0